MIICKSIYNALYKFYKASQEVLHLLKILVTKFQTVEKKTNRTPLRVSTVGLHSIFFDYDIKNGSVLVPVPLLYATLEVR